MDKFSFQPTSWQINSYVDCDRKPWKFKYKNNEAAGVDIEDSDIRVQGAFPDSKGSTMGPG